MGQYREQPSSIPLNLGGEREGSVGVEMGEEGGMEGGGEQMFQKTFPWARKSSFWSYNYLQCHPEVEGTSHVAHPCTDPGEGLTDLPAPCLP